MTDTASDTAPAPARTSARDRLLAAASDLFYAEGIHTVGIDRVIERAGVAKASLYNTFGSKDELVRAYLQSRHAITRERIETGLARWDDPREKVLGVFTLQAERMLESDYCGCPFVSASVESPAGSPARQATADYRDWLRDVFRDLATAAGATDADRLARQLLMLYDGAALAMRIDGDREAAGPARAAASALLDGSASG